MSIWDGLGCPAAGTAPCLGASSLWKVIKPCTSHHIYLFTLSYEINLSVDLYVAERFIVFLCSISGVKAVWPERAWEQRLGWLLLLFFPASPLAHNDAPESTAPAPGLGRDFPQKTLGEGQAFPRCCPPLLKLCTMFLSPMKPAVPAPTAPGAPPEMFGSHKGGINHNYGALQGINTL